MFKIWGLAVEEIFVDDLTFWRVRIKKPFFEDGRWKIGLNKKLFLEARKKGVERLLVKIGERQEWLIVPNKKVLKAKERRGEFEDRSSMFEGGKPMRIYYFYV